jgi:GNAT superfamily N-acetyltransferase
MPTLRVTTWYLEMRAPPAREPIAAPRGVELRRADGLPLHFYRYLYETVGRDWLWVDRRRMGDGELGELVLDSRVEVWVAYERGWPAGYAELDLRTPREIQLAYFGVVPEAIGRGVGPWLLDAAVRRAWSFEPAVLRVNTCSLDHPAARRTYERAGFVLTGERAHEMEDPRPLPVRPR